MIQNVKKKDYGVIRKGNTLITNDTEAGSVTVRLHATDIVSFDLNTITLNSGGYQTVTTKDRMNSASRQFNLGYYVYQKNFDWFVHTDEGETIRFEDGMQLPLTGMPNIPDGVVM